MKSADKTILVAENDEASERIRELTEECQALKWELTACRERENALLESDKELKSIFKSIPDIIYRLTPDGRISFINNAVEKYGYSPDRLVGTSIFELIHPDDREKALFKINERRTGRRRTHTHEIRLLSKKPIELEAGFEGGFVAEPVFLLEAEGLYESGDPDSKLFLGTQGVARDITERKITEEKNERLTAQLQQSQKMESIGTLAGGIAHDFNNILQAISGFVQLMNSGIDHGMPDKSHLDEIEKAVDRAAYLTRSLLTFSRKVEPETRPLDLSPQVGHAIIMLKRLLPKMIEIRANLAKDLKPVNADPNQLEQILLNLGANARDAMPDGGDLIIETENISLTKEETLHRLGLSAGDFVVLRFTDTGHGMDGDTVRRIFEPFFTTKEEGKGTGLGLATTFGIVKSHKGQITCHSKPGIGTTFTIYLPVMDEMISSGSEAASKAKEQIPGGNETILVVDDDEAILEIARSILEGYGYSVLTAESGEQALELYAAEGERIDLVILDLGMPGIGGYKCMNKLIAADPETKVVIASGYSSKRHVADSMESGAAGFISKPYRMVTLLKTLREVLDD